LSNVDRYRFNVYSNSAAASRRDSVTGLRASPLNIPPSAPYRLQALAASRKHHFPQCSLMYRDVNGTAPMHPTELFCSCTDTTRLRPACTDDFHTPRTNRRFTGSAFRVAAPLAWNQLPEHLRNYTAR